MTDSEIEFLNTFMDKLDKLMRDKDIGYDAQLLEHIDIAQSRFSQIRNKHTVPTITEIMEIANYFKVPIDYLVYSDNDNSNTCTSWKNWTHKEVIEMLIDMHTEKIITFKPSIEFDGYEAYATNEYGVFLSDNYIQDKINEWFRVSEPFTKEYHSYNDETLRLLKRGFLNDVSEMPFFLPPFI